MCAIHQEILYFIFVIRETKNLCYLTDEVLQNFFSIFTDDGTTAKKSLSNTPHTGSLSCNISKMIKRNMEIKLKIQEFYLYQTPAQIAIKIFQISAQLSSYAEVCK